MTRACSSISRPASPKSKCCTIGSQPVRMQEGGVTKRQIASPIKKSFMKSTTKSDCYVQLKNMLPRARHEENTSELALVEETIAYITYLESILSTSNDQNPVVSSAVELLKNMSFA